MQSSHRSAPDGLIEALDLALARVGAGESLETCLENFAPHAADLAPLLSVDALLRAEAAKPLPPEMERWLHAGARDFRAIAQQIAPRRARRITGPRLPRHTVQRTVMAVAVTATLLGTVDTVSAQSLPGEPLYTWKIAREDISLQLAANPETRGMLHVDYAKRRLAEVDRLAASGASDAELIEQTLSSLVNHVQGAVSEAARADGDGVQPALDTLLSEVQQTLVQVASEAPTSTDALNETREQLETITQPLDVAATPPPSVAAPAAIAGTSEPSLTPTPQPSQTLLPTSGVVSSAPIIITDPLASPTVTPSATRRPASPDDTSVPSAVPPTSTAVPQPTDVPSSTAIPPTATPRPRDGEPAPTNTPRPTNTLPPTATRAAFTEQPTGLAEPTDLPTRTPRPTLTPTRTPVPPTETPVPPTETPSRTPTYTPTRTPRPTSTPTDTPVPPTDTPVPPTDTPVPPTETPVPPTEAPTDTPASPNGEETLSGDTSPTPSVAPSES
ncbi:MAG: hypothetical protein RLZZ387_3773 [Chloroflexota bacterium]